MKIKNVVREIIIFDPRQRIILKNINYSRVIREVLFFIIVLTNYFAINQ